VAAVDVRGLKKKIDKELKTKISKPQTYEPQFKPQTELFYVYREIYSFVKILWQTNEANIGSASPSIFLFASFDVFYIFL
jgi:hypothetical protein